MPSNEQTSLSETPQALHDLSISLEKMGNVARELGQLEDANDYLRQSKQIIELLNNLSRNA